MYFDFVEASRTRLRARTERPSLPVFFHIFLQRTKTNMQLRAFLALMLLALVGLITPVSSASIFSPVTQTVRDWHYSLTGPQFNRKFMRAVKDNDARTVSEILNGLFAKNLDTVTLIDSAIVARQRGHLEVARLIEDHNGFRSTRTVTKWWRKIARWFKQLKKRVKKMF
jgi:hypothetical protein